MKTEKKTFEISELKRRFSVIDLDPDFQRGKVWKSSRQELLIDTILKEWGMPKIYLFDQSNSSDNESYLCIDGKQRILTIFEFLQNKLKISLKGKECTYDQLSLKDQDKFENYKIDVEIVKDATDDEIAELFRRLQNGSTLNSAEKLKSNTGEMLKFCLALTRHDFFKKEVSIKDSRNSHLAIALQISLLGVEGEIQNLKYKDLEKFLETYRSFNSKGVQAKHIEEILTFIAKNFSKEKVHIFLNRGNIVTVFYLLHEISKRINLNKVEKKVINFLKLFFEDIANQKINKDDAFEYQIASIQSADSSTSIRKRHEIILKNLINYDKIFEDIFNIKTKKDEFEELYFELEKKFGDSGKFRKHLKKNDPTNIVVSGKRNGSKDHLIMFVRDALISHRNNKKCTPGQLEEAINLLKKLNK